MMILKLNMEVIITPDLCCLQVTEPQIAGNNNGASQATEEAEEDDDGGDIDGVAEDTDEEYVPIAEPSSLSPSPSTARKRKTVCKPDKNENGEAVEEESKKDSVQCPVCDKSFKSKYYLKVHNRYTSQYLFVSKLLLKEWPLMSVFHRRHTGERPFGCLKCGKRYFRKENLLIHEIRDCARVQVS